MGELQWSVQVWSHPLDADGFRLLDTPPIIAANTGDREDAVGSGSITVPADYEYLDQIIAVDPADISTSKSSLIALFRPGATTPDFEFFAEDMTETLSDENPVVVISGQDARSGPDDAVVHPRSDLINDWIWGGENVLPPLGIADLQSDHAEWDIWLERERYGLSIAATGGTMTFSFNGNTSSSVSNDPSAGAIQGALEGLAGISTVYVTKHEDDSFTIVVMDPTDLPSNITVNVGSLTGGSATLTKQADGFDDSSNPELSIVVVTGEGSEETVDFAYNASGLVVENRLQALANVFDVTVQGAGTYESPWRVIFYNPTVINDLQVNFAAGAEIALEAGGGGLNPSPVTQSLYADQRIEPALHGQYGVPPIEAITDAAHLDIDASWALQVNAEGQFAGSQVVFSVTPGQTYQASIRVKPSVTGRYRLVIRDRFERLVKWHSPNEIQLTAGSYQTLSISDIVIPSAVTEVIMRVAVVSAASSEIDTFWVNWESAEFLEGLAKTTAGDIAITLNDVARERGALLWLQDGFTATEDSNGDAWDVDDLSFRADVGEKHGTHMLGDLKAMGYPYDVVRLDTPDGDFTHELLLYNPNSRGEESLQAVVIGSFQGGRFAKRRPPYTHLLVEDDTGATTTVTVDDLSGHPRREEFLRAEFAPTLAAATKIGQSTIADDVADLLATQVEFADDTVVPYRDFDIAWTVPYELGRRAAHHDRTVHSISLQLRDDVWRAEVTASRLYPSDDSNGGARMWEAIRRLYAEFARRRRPRPVGNPILGGGGGAPTVVVAAADASSLSKGKADYICTGTDDKGVIRAAYDAIDQTGFKNGRVLLTEGTYTIDVSDGWGLDFTNIGTAGVHLQGMSRGATRIVQSGTVSDGQVILWGATGIVSDFTLEIASNSGDTVHGLNVVNTDQTVVRNIDVVGSGSGDSAGIRFANNGGSLVTGCTVTHNGPIGIQVAGVTDTRVVDNYVEGSDIGISVAFSDGVTVLGNTLNVAPIVGEECERTSIVGNQIHNTLTFAIDLVYEFGVTDARWLVADNQIHSPEGGIRLFGDGGAVTQATVIGNMIIDSTDTAIVLDTVEDAVVNGNRIHSTSLATAVLLDGCNKIVVVGNGILESDFHGVSLVDSSDCLIEANHITDPSLDATNTYDGINLAGDSDDNTLFGNVILTTGDARYGINIGAGTCNTNAYIGNRALGSFGTGAYGNSGTGTVNTWPGAGGAQGDNLT